MHKWLYVTVMNWRWWVILPAVLCLLPVVAVTALLDLATATFAAMAALCAEANGWIEARFKFMGKVVDWGVKHRKREWNKRAGEQE